MSQRETKSPISDQPMRQAGQSTREKIDNFFDDEIMPYFVAATATMVIAIFEWLRVIFKCPPQPITATGLFVLALLLLIRKIQKNIKNVKQMRLGELGEQAVGQFLEEKLRPMGFQVFHDVLGADFNVDHIIVGPAGLYCIETKTHRKPKRGECRISYDGEKVTVNGFTPDRDPVVQARAEAKWVSDLVAKSTGKKFFVQPVVIYPGWFVEKTCQHPEVWVLNEKALPSFIKNVKTALSDEDVALVAYHLKRYVISRDK
jgi:hypothetical protein